MLVGFELGVFRKHRHIEGFRLHNHVVREIRFVHRHRDSVRLARDLRHRVDDAAVVLAAVLRRQNENPVGQIVHCLCVHVFPFYI